MPTACDVSGNSILIIDDEEVFSKQLSTLLHSLGLEVTRVENAQQALDKIANTKFDLILCDIVMPELDGIAFLKAFREQDRATPVVMISGHNDMRKVDSALKLGASDYLMKPIRDVQDFKSNILSYFSVPELDQVGRSGLLQDNLAEHLGHYRANDMAASRLLTDLLPETPQMIANFHVYYRRRGVHIVPEFLSIKDGRFCLFAFDLSGLAQDASVAGVIVKSLINEAYRRYNQGRDKVITCPDKFCASVNRQLWRAHIKAPIPFFHLVSDEVGTQFEFCNAGFVELSGTLAAHSKAVAMPLGTSELSKYQLQKLNLKEPIADFGLGNLHGERLYFKLGCL